MSDPLLPEALRDEFPLLRREFAPGRPLIYLDSAATALKPHRVIEAVTDALSMRTGNINRAVHSLGDEATELFEDARRKAARLVGAEPHEIVFVRNTTEAINLVARCHRHRGRVLVSRGEHHSNLLPWGLEVASPPTPDGGPDLSGFQRELGRGGVSIVSVSHVSNVTGIRTDVRALADVAHAAGAALFVDAAQSVPHSPIDVQEMGCDYLAFSGHKMGSPAGVGVLYGKAERLAELDWHLRGGGTVEEVTGGVATPRHAPWRFEAGTPPVEAVIGLGAACEFLQEVGPENVEAHCKVLYARARERLKSIPGATILGPKDGSGLTGPLSFTIPDALSHMLARALSDGFGVCARSGHHCAQPLHEALRSPPSLRLSFWVYNRPWEIDLAFDALARVAGASRG